MNDPIIIVISHWWVYELLGIIIVSLIDFLIHLIRSYLKTYNLLYIIKNMSLQAEM
jgi:hypothetical protein